MKLFYREQGEGQPIVILHGVFGSCDNWITPAKMLSDKNKLFLVDQRNHGHSPNSDEFTNSIMADDLKEFIEEHNIVDPIIIGHSMGGKVAMTFASRYKSLLKKLIVVDISPRYYPPHHQSIIAGLKSIDLPNLKSRQEADEQLSKYVSELGVRQFLLKNIYRNEANEFAWRINLPVISEKINNICEPLDPEVRIDIPTLFIRGSESDYIRENDEVLIKSIFSDVKIATIEGAGHWVQAEKPKEFIEEIVKFI